MVVALVLAMPALARHVAAGARLTLSRMELSDLRDHAVRLRMQGTVDLAIPSFAPACRMQPTRLTLSYDFGQHTGGSPLAEQVRFSGRHVLATTLAPAQSLSSTTLVDITANMEIVDEDAFAALCVICINSADDVTLIITGSVDSKVGSWSLHQIPVELHVKTWGLSSLRTMDMKGFNLYGSDADGVLVNSTVLMNNPGGFAISGIGAVNVEISTEGHYLGSIHMPDLHVEPGTVDVVASGHVRPANLPAAASLFSNWLCGKRPSMSVRASSGNASAPAWLRAGLAALVGTARMPEYDGAQPVAGVELKGTSFTVDAANDMFTGFSGVSLVQTPFAFPYNIVRAEVTAYILGASGESVAVLKIPPTVPQWQPDLAHPGHGNLTMSITGAKLQPLDMLAFGRESAVMMGATSRLHFKGIARVTTTSVLGEMTIEMPWNNVSVEFDPSFNQFQGMVITSMDMLDGSPGHLQLVTSLDVPNPSIMTVNMTTCAKTIVGLEGLDIGTVSVCNTVLRPHGLSPQSGVHVEMSGLTEQTAMRMRESISRYVNGHDTILDVRGDYAGVTGPLQPFMGTIMSAFRSKTMLRGLPKGIIGRAEMGLNIDLTKLPLLYVPAKLFIDNPWSGSMEIVRVGAQVFAHEESGDFGLLLGEIPDTDLSNNPLKVKGKDVVPQPQAVHPLPVNLLIGNCAIGKLESCLGDLKQLFVSGHLLVRIACSMEIVVGHGYALEIEYGQLNVPVELRPWIGAPGTLGQQEVSISGRS